MLSGWGKLARKLSQLVLMVRAELTLIGTRKALVSGLLELHHDHRLQHNNINRSHILRSDSDNSTVTIFFIDFAELTPHQLDGEDGPCFAKYFLREDIVAPEMEWVNCDEMYNMIECSRCYWKIGRKCLKIPTLMHRIITNMIQRLSSSKVTIESMQSHFAHL